MAILFSVEDFNAVLDED